MKDWLYGFDDVTDTVRNSVDLVKNHPLMDPLVPVHGLVIDPSTGKIDTIVNGYSKSPK